MVTTNLQKKIFPKLYNYKYELICDLVESINVTEELRFGSLSTLTFEYPYYLIDAMNNVIYDSNNEKVKNPKIDYIENDYLCLFNNSWYIIKVDETSRNDSNALTLLVTCHSIGYELQEKIVEYLYIQPPITTAVNVTTAISEILEACQQIRDNIIVSATTNTAVLDANAFPVDNYYNGFKIKILSGTGVGQIRTISGYNATTKTVTISSNWTTLPTSTSVYRIYNDIWRVGTIDPVFNTNLRSHTFDYVNALEALQTAIGKYLNPSTDEAGFLTYSASFDAPSNRWIKLVNLVKPNDYTGIQFRYKKNMKSITRQKFTQELYTKIIPSGVDNLGVNTIATSNRTDNSITYPEHVLGYNYIENYQYFLGLGYTYKECIDNFTKEYRFSDERYTTASELFNDCKKMLNKMSVPKVVYQVSVLDLSKITGREYESFRVGDTIKVYDEELNFDVDAVISSMSISQENPQNASVELTNFVENFSDIINRIVNRNDKYSATKSLYGKGTTVVIADKKTSKNWRYADYVVNENEDAGYVIRKVIESIDPANGGGIVLLDGTYNCSSSIELADNISIEGQGTATKLIGNLSIVGISASSVGLTKRKNISIKNLYMSTFSNGISISNCDNVSVQNVSLESMDNNFIIIQNSSTIDVLNNVLGVESQVQGNDGIDIKNSSNVVINNNTIYSVGLRNINIESASGETTVSNNYIINTQSQGTILACIFLGQFGTQPTAGWETQTQLYSVNVVNNTIASNTVKPCIGLWTTRNVIISGNKLMGGSYGMDLIFLLDCKINNNTMTSSLNGYEGIHLYGMNNTTAYTGRSEIQLNTIYNPSGGFGIRFSTTALTLQDMFVTNNDLKYSCTNPAVNGLFLNGNTVTTSAGNRL